LIIPIISSESTSTKLLILQLSPTSYSFIPLQSTYPLQYPVLKYPQSMFFP
jgi:hypothetical protein